MKLLVTGVAGFIGSNFVNYYLEKNNEDEIIGIDKLTYSGVLKNFDDFSNTVKNRFKFIKGDIQNTELIEYLLTEYQPQYIINFAAESHVDRSIEDPMIFFNSNIIGVANLLETAKKFWYKNGTWKEGKRFLQISTDEVYGSLGPTGEFTEFSPIDPHSPYSASKASADLLVKAFYDTYKMPILISRCSNNYGTKQFPEKFIPVIITKLLKHDKIPIYGNGLQIRDWLHVQDHCSAIEMILDKGKIGNTYNIGGNNEIKNIDLAKLIIQILSEITGDKDINDSLISYVEDRLGHDVRYAIDSTKIQQEIGWKPNVEFSKGIRETINWYYNQFQNIS
ncbi:MAG: dTDP-glucose 4,6-dehydratase [Candidatus Heimdallarchaeota archaeon]|nr:dTDP-glucose 4,6-dehydratase [Candidatus Heimdallarchaeota archaeon]